MNILIKRIRPFSTSAVWAMEKVVVAKKKEYQEVLPENISKQNARAITRKMQFFLFIALLQFRMQSFKDGLPEIALQIAIAHQPHTASSEPHQSTRARGGPRVF